VYAMFTGSLPLEAGLNLHFCTSLHSDHPRGATPPIETAHRHDAVQPVGILLQPIADRPLLPAIDTAANRQATASSSHHRVLWLPSRAQ